MDEIDKNDPKVKAAYDAGEQDGYEAGQIKALRLALGLLNGKGFDVVLPGVAGKAFEELKAAVRRLAPATR